MPVNTPIKPFKRRYDGHSETSAQRGYGYKWQKARATFLKSHPLCVICERLGKFKDACVVDHIQPHKGDMVLFWDSSNWQSLCQHCHDSVKKAQEMGGLMPGCDVDGIPIDSNHHWHRR
jgi:5-methylcytosine-specific restriction endonuclease McrA